MLYIYIYIYTKQHVLAHSDQKELNTNGIFGYFLNAGVSITEALMEKH